MPCSYQKKLTLLWPSSLTESPLAVVSFVVEFITVEGQNSVSVQMSGKTFCIPRLDSVFWKCEP